MTKFQGLIMIPNIAMREYVKKAIKEYQNTIKQDDIYYNELFNEYKHLFSPEHILHRYGWIRIIPSPNSRFKIKDVEVQEMFQQRDAFYRAYYNSEYDLRIDLAFSADGELKLIQWFVNEDSSSIEQTGCNAFTLYCILQFGGNIKAAAKNFILSGSERRRYLLEMLNIDEHSSIDYCHPPSAIAVPHLSEFTLNLTEKVFELEEKLNQLQKFSSPNIPVVKQPPSTQVTGSSVRNQTDGTFNQAYSQAHYAFWQECKDRKYFNPTGIPIGYYLENLNTPTNQLIYYQGETHLITIAPTGSGKLTAVQIPTLMEYNGSIIALDPKGEAAIISALQRQRLGQEVCIINPFEILKSEFEGIGFKMFHGFNPLALLDVNDDNFVADVAAISEALILDDNSSIDPYWNDSARDLISCLIMYVCIDDKEKKNKHLPRVREILTSSPEAFTKTMLDISKHKSNFKPMMQKTSRYITEGNGSVPSIISTAMTHTLFLDDPRIAANLQRNDFNFQDLKTSKKTIYLILPAKFLLAYNRWLRLLITSALDTLMSTHNKPEKSVLFMLDEFAVLGNLSCIETAIGLARGYGIQLWLFLQDLHQLHHLYKDKAESFLANTGMQQYFVPNDLTTAERISKRMGNTTLVDEKITSDTVTDNWGRLIPNTPVKIDISHKERPLLYPIEIMALNKDVQLVFFAGDANPILMMKNFYYDNPYYKGKYDKNPYVKESQIL